MKLSINENLKGLDISQLFLFSTISAEVKHIREQVGLPLIPLDPQKLSKREIVIRATFCKLL